MNRHPGERRHGLRASGTAAREMLAGALLLTVAACSKVTAENYDKIKVNMKRDEVHRILGKPDEVSGGDFGPISMSAETWKGNKQTVTVTFGGDKVVLKATAPNEPAE